MKKVFLILLNYNGWKDTRECLESVEKLETKSLKLEIVIVDNGSGDESIREIRGIGQIRVIKNSQNLGFAEGNNVGIRYALQNGADYILLLNNDTLVEKKLLVELVDFMEKDQSVGITSPKIYFAPGCEYHKNRYQKEDLGKVFWYAGGVMDWKNLLGVHRGVDEVDRGQYGILEETDFTTGCCILIRREVFQKVGLLDPQYYLYYEDSDFCQRVKAAGYKIFYNPKGIVWHKNAGSAGGSGSALQDYYTTRNRLLFGTKYAPLRTKLALVKESLKLLKNGREWQKIGVKDFYLRKFGKGSFK